MTTSLHNSKQKLFSATSLKTNGLLISTGVDFRKLAFSWKISTEIRGFRQIACHIQVSHSNNGFRSITECLWDSGEIESGQPFGFAYTGQQLDSLKSYWWRVRICSNDNLWSDWSEPAHFITGVINSEDWSSTWVGPSSQSVNEGEKRPGNYYRNEFSLNGKKIKSAKIAITCHGIYTASINGHHITEDRLRPGFTSYKSRLQYQVYEIGHLLKPDNNAIGVVVTDGWYRGAFGLIKTTNIFGVDSALYAQIKIYTEDGEVFLTGTDERWRWSNEGPVRICDFSHGEVYDAQLEFDGWTEPEFDDSNWKSVQVELYGQDTLVCQRGASVRARQEIEPIEMKKTQRNSVIYDLGQNIAGTVRLYISGPKGTKIIIRYSETLTENGVPNLEPYYDAKQELCYTLKGTGKEEIYEPLHLSQGFQYIELEGVPGEPKLTMIKGVVIYTDLEETGKFHCSDNRVNQLQSNILWTQRSNFIEVPTDCPHREKMGWSGDLQAFCPTAAFNMDISEMIGRWLEDYYADYQSAGEMPLVIPEIYTWQTIGFTMKGSAGWRDAAAIVPWTLYKKYGDKTALSDNYKLMWAVVDIMEQHAKQTPATWPDGYFPAEHEYLSADDPHIINTGFHFGDWLAPDNIEPPQLFLYNLLNVPAWLATAYFAHSVDCTLKASKVLGKHDDSRHLSHLFGKIKSAFNKWFVDPDGSMIPDTQGAYVLALRFGLLDDTIRKKMADRLVTRVHDANDHLTTGIMTTSHLCHALSENGYATLAYRLLFQDTAPSWLYPVTQGATTIWERWDCRDSEGNYLTKLGSLNHYVMGSIGDWLYSVVAGLGQHEDSAGYSRILIQPDLRSGLDYASASYESVRGKIVSTWRICTQGKYLHVEITIPPTSNSTVLLPNAKLSEVCESKTPIDSVEGVLSARQVDTFVELEIGSGSYVLTYPIRRD